VKGALPPDWRAWTARSSEVSSALDDARARWLDGAPIALTPLADATVSIAVVWFGFSAEGATIGAGQDPQQTAVAALTDVWIAERGLIHALDALATATGYAQEVRPPVVHQGNDVLQPSRAAVRWRRLREHIAAATDDEHALVRLHAERMRRDATPIVRALTSYLFPMESAWAGADAESTGPERLALIGTAIDAATCTAILADNVALAPTTFDDGRLQAMVALLGDEAVGPLLALMQRRVTAKPAVAQLIARFPTHDVANVLALSLEREEADTARGFFWRNPKLVFDVVIDAKLDERIEPRSANLVVACAVARDHEGACDLAHRTHDARIARLLASLGATDRWIKKKPPPRLVASAKSFPAVAAWIAAGAPWLGRAALQELVGRELFAFIRAASDVAPIAFAAVDVLARADDAAKWLGRLVGAAVPAEVGEYAHRHLSELQASHGLSDDDVADLAIPSYAGVLDIGSRRLFARLDAELRPGLFDESEERLAAFPRAGKDTDADAIARAGEAWATFRDNAAHEAREQARRMEHAMLAEREFSEAVVPTLVRHPVLGALARRLLWRDARGVLFRIAEDGSFADAGDHAIEVQAPLRIAHPASLEERERTRWSEVFGSYEIVQPFTQLGC
jgi:hypothetical protein